MIFHPKTLGQLAYLRRVLSPTTPEDAFLIGAVLGIMHGKHRKGGRGTSYLSIDMPNTFSMSAPYVERFVKEHGLVQPRADVFAKLRERAAWLLRDGCLPSGPTLEVLVGDATQMPATLGLRRTKRISTIITSPPYLGVLKYGMFNWIRAWFLGYRAEEIDALLDATDSLDRWYSFMLSFFLSAGEVLKPGGHMLLVIGDVVTSGECLPLAERLWGEMEGLVPFDLGAIEVQEIGANQKTTRIWGEGRKGQATPRDRVLLLQRSGARKRARTARRT